MHPSSQRALRIFGGFLLSFYLFFMHTGLMIGLADNGSIPFGYWNYFLWMITFTTAIGTYFMMKYSYWKGFIFQGIWLVFVGISAKYYEHMLFLGRDYLLQDNSDISSRFVITGILIASVALYLKNQPMKLK